MKKLLIHLAVGCGLLAGAGQDVHGMTLKTCNNSSQVDVCCGQTATFVGGNHFACCGATVTQTGGGGLCCSSAATCYHDIKTTCYANSGATCNLL